MLTPSYSLTATERVLPRLALDFTTGVLDSRVTITRALNTATRVNSSGFIEVVNADLPRFDYSPTSVGTPRGLLIEETRANILLQSQDFSTSWSRVNANVSTDAGVSPDGTSNADLFIPTTNPGSLNQGASKAASSLTYTLSVYVKPSGFTTFRMFVFGVSNANRGDAIFSLTGNGSVSSVVSVGTFTNTSATVTPAGNGYYRCTVTTTSNTDTTIAATLRYDGTVDGVSGFLLYGAQLEQGAFATSYIPTTTTSLTRNGDFVSMTGTNFSSWYNAAEGTLAIQAIGRVGTGGNYYYALSDGTLNNAIYGFAGSNNGAVRPLYAYVSNSEQATLNSTVNCVGTYTLVAAYKQNNFIASVSGNAPTTDALGTIPTVNRLAIGCAISNVGQLNGHIAKVSYWPMLLTSAEVQAFSK